MWFLAPKIRGLLTRVPLSTGELIGMRLRGTPVNLVIDAAISLRMQGHPFRSDTIALIEQVYLEDKRRHSDSRSLADAVADGADLATTVAATLETAISDGSFATAIASAATSLSVSSMSAVSATGVSVDTQMPTPAPTTPEQTPAPEKRHAARSSLGRWLGRACSQASCVGPASSFDDHTVRMGFRRGHSSHHAGVSMATVRHYFAQTVSRTRRGATSS